MQSNDIDVALSDMMGMTFAKHFVSYCTGQKHIPVKGIARVESNPDQSKHLETAKTSVLGLDIDFVNLRSEEYAENSRIPTQVVSQSVFICTDVCILVHEVLIHTIRRTLEHRSRTH